MLIKSPDELARLFVSQRKLRRLSQHRLAAKVNSRQKQVSHFENQPESIRLECLLKLLAANGLEMHLVERSVQKKRRWEGDW